MVAAPTEDEVDKGENVHCPTGWKYELLKKLTKLQTLYRMRCGQETPRCYGGMRKYRRSKIGNIREVSYPRL